MTACREWQAATVDALVRIADAIGVTPACMTVKTDGLIENLWPLSTAKACNGDGVFTDFHDYLSGRQQEQVVADISTRNLNYPLVVQSIEGVMGDTVYAPVCDGMRPVGLYFPSMVAMHRALSGLAEYQTCMSQCRKPTRFEERLYQLPDRVEGAVQRLEEIKGGLREAEVEREERLRGEGHFSIGCVALRRLGELMVGADDEIAALREAIAAAAQLGEGLQEVTVEGLEQRVQRLEESVMGVDLEHEVKDCDAETATALELVERKQGVINELSGSSAVALEALERFGAMDEKPGACESTADCPLPYRCKGGKCWTAVDVGKALRALHDAEKLLRQARDVELLGKSGMVERAGEKLDSLEVRLSEIRGELEKSGWTDAAGAWAEEYKNAHLVRMEGWLQELSGLVEEMGEFGGGPENRECRRAKRTLETCMSDIQRSKEALAKSDAIANANWFKLKVTDAVTAFDGCKAEAGERLELCGGGEEEAVGETWQLVVIAGAGLLVVVVTVMVFLLVRRRRVAGAGR